MKLPEIYKNKIDENINNNTRNYVKKNNEQPESIEEILKALPVTVYILLKNREFTATIIDRTENYIITKNRDVLYIKDIIKIKKV